MDFLKDFGVKPVLLAAQVVNFFILLIILKKFLYGPVLNVLEKRKKIIEQSLKNAQDLEKRLLQTEEDREKILAKASEQAQKLMDQTKKEITLIKEEAKLAVQHQTELIFKKGEEALKVEKDRMVSEARGEVLGLVVTLFHKVAGRAITKDDQKKLFEREVKNLS